MVDKSLRGFLAFSFAAMALPLHATVIRVADGDSTGLTAALTQAAAVNEPIEVILAPKGTYRLIEGIAIERGQIRVQGSGARLIPSSSDPELSFLKIGTEADVRIESIDLVGETAATALAPILVIEGRLELRSSTVHDISGSRSRSSRPPIDILPSAHVRFENVTLSNINTPCLALGWGCILTVPGLRVAGELELDQVTVSRLRRSNEDGIEISPGGRLLAHNSWIEADSFNCSRPGFHSEGGNALGDSACVGPRDVVLGDSAPALPALALAGGLVPTLALSQEHPASNVGVDCLALDARGAVRRPQACSAGAFESDAQFGDNRLAGGSGKAGVWFEQGNDGHYVQLQPIDESEWLLTWMHFDNAGQPAWVYALLSGSGRQLNGVAYRNRSEALRGSVRGGRAEDWGELQLEFDNCDRLHFSFTSSSSALGSGSLTLQRLTLLPSVGCHD